MTYDDLISWVIETLPNARAAELRDGEIAILTGYREDHLTEDLVPIDLGSDDPTRDG